MDDIELKTICVQEITQSEIKQINGGGWIADIVEFILCDLCWLSHSKAYSSTMARRAI